MHSLALFSMLISSTAALGINCRGSGGCFVNNSSLSDLMGQIKQIQNQGHGQRIYDTGGAFLPIYFASSSCYTTGTPISIHLANRTIQQCKSPAQRANSARSAHSTRAAPKAQPIVRLSWFRDCWTTGASSVAAIRQVRGIVYDEGSLR